MGPTDRPNPGDPGPLIPDPDETRPRDPREVPVIAPVRHGSDDTPHPRDPLAPDEPTRE